MTAIKAEDILTTLQSLELIQYRKGQHVICADPKVLDRHLKAAGRGGLDVDVSKLIWTPYKEQSWWSCPSKKYIDVTCAFVYRVYRLGLVDNLFDVLVLTSKF